MLLIGVEEEDTLHEVLVEHSRVPDLEQVRQTELGKPTEVRVHQTADTVEEEGAPPLDVIFLEQSCYQSQRLPPYEERVVLETGGNDADVRIHFGGVADGKVAEDYNNVVAYRSVFGRLQLSRHLHHRALGKTFVLETQLA